MISRRKLLKSAGQGILAVGCAPFSAALSKREILGQRESLRCVNLVNFIRGNEPRFKTDLLLPVQKQMELIRKYDLPASWLLQFDALVSGPFVDFLRQGMAQNHEVGFWFEMNQMLCKAADVEWRGRPGFEWDSSPPVAFTLGYTPEERIQLCDTAMRRFKSVWGQFPKAVGSWNLDSLTASRLAQKYQVDAFAVCRDQIATDGFTIWGAPIAGYFPSTSNIWSPAVERAHQISTPVFRMLGQDPVYYYNRNVPLPDGRTISEPDTMEPVWTSGRSPIFVRRFLHMIEDEPALDFAYAQLGQENSFPWPDMAEAYPSQMKALAELRSRGSVHVETLGETGRRFKAAFTQTPPQAQVQLSDPFGNSNLSAKSIWYQSRIYRANLHFEGDLFYFRDITVYSDRFPQPFLKERTRETNVEQRMPAILDGFHWSPEPGTRSAGGHLLVGGVECRLEGEPAVSEHGKSLTAQLKLQGGGGFRVEFSEEVIRVALANGSPLTLSFQWNPSKSALVEVASKRVAFRWQGFDYWLSILDGHATPTPTGFTVTGSTEIRLGLAQPV